MENFALYERVRAVPKKAQKEISGGRMKGMTDINPMWRIKVLTQEFGPCGVGWYYKPIRKWTESAEDEICSFVDIELFVKVNNEWSMPIAGTGGSKLSAREKSGINVSDECYKMATTDALSVACKQLGIGADVYFSKDSTKYDKQEEAQTGAWSANTTADKSTAQGKATSKSREPGQSKVSKEEKISDIDISVLQDYFADNGISEEKVLKKYSYQSFREIPCRIFTNITNPSNLNYFRQKCGVDT